jgi:hypothetical protein
MARAARIDRDAGEATATDEVEVIRFAGYPHLFFGSVIMFRRLRLLHGLAPPHAALVAPNLATTTVASLQDVINFQLG